MELWKQHRLLRSINEGLRHCIRDHGPITKEEIGSAGKRILARVRNTIDSNFEPGEKEKNREPWCRMTAMLEYRWRDL